MALDRTVLARRRRAIRDGLKVAVVYDSQSVQGIPCATSAERVVSTYGAADKVDGTVKLMAADLKAKPKNGKHITVAGAACAVKGVRTNSSETAYTIDYKNR